MFSSMSFRLALGAIDRNGLSPVGTSQDELGFAGAELSNTLTQVVDSLDFTVTNPFDDVKDVDSGFRSSAAAFYFHDQGSRRHRPQRRLAQLPIDKRNPDTEIRDMEGRGESRRGNGAKWRQFP